MESLSDSTWDVVISGTGLPQALLALSLSRSGKKILHVDKNRYYGGNDAAFTLEEAEQWAKSVNTGQDRSFSDARIARTADELASEFPTSALSSRAYSLSIAPQIIYAKSRLLQTLVSSQLHSQLEFLAVGSWWTHIEGRLRKIPASREDVFVDDTLSRREKGALMKLLRYVAQEPDAEVEDATESLSHVLSSQFGVPYQLHSPLLALSLSPKSSDSTEFAYGMSRIKRHVQSLGVFGAGFGAVIPKYGGNAEIAQVACRACAVGGGVYVLGQSIKTLATGPPEPQDGNDRPHSSAALEIELSTGEKVKATRVVGSIDDLPEESLGNVASPLLNLEESVHSISIISDPLVHLLPPISDSGPPSAVAIVLVDGMEDVQPRAAPVYLQVHSEETGECPRGQCIIYGSVRLENERSRDRLQAAVKQLINPEGTESPPRILWSVSYAAKRRVDKDQSTSLYKADSDRVILFPPKRLDLSFDDDILNGVLSAWSDIMEDAADDEEFMRFVEREQSVDDD